MIFSTFLSLSVLSISDLSLSVQSLSGVQHTTQYLHCYLNCVNVLVPKEHAGSKLHDGYKELLQLFVLYPKVDRIGNCPNPF